MVWGHNLALQPLRNVSEQLQELYICITTVVAWVTAAFWHDNWWYMHVVSALDQVQSLIGGRTNTSKFWPGHFRNCFAGYSVAENQVPQLKKYTIFTDLNRTAWWPPAQVNFYKVPNHIIKKQNQKEFFIKTQKGRKLSSGKLQLLFQ